MSTENFLLRNPPLVRALSSLSQVELREALLDVLQDLYLDYGPGVGFYWNPSLEWDADTLDDVARHLRDRGLALRP